MAHRTGCLGMLFLAAGAVFAQAATFEGVVSNSIAEALDSVRVSLREVPGAQALTGKSGRFLLDSEILALRPGVEAPRETFPPWPAYAWTRGGMMRLHDMAGRIGDPAMAGPGRARRGAETARAKTLAAKTGAVYTLVFAKAGYQTRELSLEQGRAGISMVLEFTEARDRVLADYHRNYLASSVSPAELVWTGSVEKCEAGRISAGAQAKTLARVNYFRRMVGLTPVTFNPALDAKAKQAALMMMANNTLDHNPPATWKCFTPDGSDGAGHSNLAYLPATVAITDYMRDPGAGNHVLGHRRWILYPKTREMGHGSTPTFNALYNVTSFMPDYPPDLGPFQAWPPAGFVPAPLVFPRWSFSVPKADFSAAKVEMTGPDGKPVLLTQLAYTPLYGEPTLAWEPQGIDLNNSADVTYAIKVSAIKSAPSAAYTYTVTVIKP